MSEFPKGLATWSVGWAQTCAVGQLQDLARRVSHLAAAYQSLPRVTSREKTCWSSKFLNCPNPLYLWLSLWLSLLSSSSPGVTALLPALTNLLVNGLPSKSGLWLLPLGLVHGQYLFLSAFIAPPCLNGQYLLLCVLILCTSPEFVLARKPCLVSHWLAAWKYKSNVAWWGWDRINILNHSTWIDCNTGDHNTTKHYPPSAPPHRMRSVHYGNIFEYLSLWSELQVLTIQKRNPRNPKT